MNTRAAVDGPGPSLVLEPAETAPHRCARRRRRAAGDPWPPIWRLARHLVTPGRGATQRPAEGRSVGRVNLLETSAIPAATLSHPVASSSGREFAGRRATAGSTRNAAHLPELLDCTAAARRAQPRIAHHQHFSTITATTGSSSKLSRRLPSSAALEWLCTGLNTLRILIHLLRRYRGPGLRRRAAPANNKSLLGAVSDACQRPMAWSDDTHDSALTEEESPARHPEQGTGQPNTGTRGQKSPARGI